MVQEAEWIRLLRKEYEKNTLQNIANRCGVSRSALSQVLNGCGNYGTGVSSTQKIEEAFLSVFARVECPFLSGVQGEPHWIDRGQCVIFATRAQPVGSAQAVYHWQACQSCKHRPTENFEKEKK